MHMVACSALSSHWEHRNNRARAHETSVSVVIETLISK